MPISPATSLDPESFTQRDPSSSYKSLRKRLLLVEDEENVLKLLERRFKSMGFEVNSARDGMDALAHARRGEFDLIILDLVLPKLSGEEVCKAIREDDNARIASVPIIMLTGKDTLADRIVGKVLGASAYLTKPCDFDDLMDKVVELSVPE
jgi:DNA-binding response OmpR family regulator